MTLCLITYPRANYAHYNPLVSVFGFIQTEKNISNIKPWRLGANLNESYLFLLLLAEPRLRRYMIRVASMCCGVSCKTWAFSCPSHIVIDSISNLHCPNAQAWGLLGNMFKLFHLNLRPPTRADCRKTAKKLVPVLRSSYSSSGENK